MNKWLTSKNRKRHQRVMNTLMKQINKNVQKDELWKGRFYVKQIASQWYSYKDKSGADLWVVLRFTDKKTGLIYDIADTVNHWHYFNGSYLWGAMNDFIINQTGVWEENPEPGSKEWFANINW